MSDEMDFATMLAGAKKGAGTIAEGPVVLQCLDATHGVSKSGGDPQIVGSFKILGGQYNGRTMKAWFTLKTDTPDSILGFYREMGAFGMSEQWINSLGRPDDMAMAKMAAQMTNKIVGAEVYHQPDNRNPGQKSAWLQGFKAHNGPVPMGAPNGSAPAPAPAPQQYQQPQYQQTPAPQPQYQQPAAPAPAAHSGMPPQHSGQYQQPAAPAPQPTYAQPAQQPQPQYQQAPAPQPQAPGYGYQQPNGQQPQAPAPQGQIPQPQAPVQPQPVPPQNAVDDPPF